MKKIVLIVLVTFSLIGLFIYWKAADEKATAQRSKMASDYVIRLSKDWSPGVLRALADPGLIKAMASQGQNAEQLLTVYSKLGRLADIPSCTYKSSISFIKGGQEVTSHSSECDVNYENADAHISITLSKPEHDEQWKIYYIHIGSDIFSQTAQ